MIRDRALPLVLALTCFAPAVVRAQGAPAHRVIFDTDFVAPPQDDGFALILALKSPELQILGVTTVAGNDTMERATADALRVLEIAGRTDVPVYRGAAAPLVHEKTEWATTVYGRWWSREPPPTPPGGFARRAAERQSAVDFIVQTVGASPGQIEIIALGPLTNLAMAMRVDPALATKVHRIAIMGGAIAALPDGGGNITPNAEYNFWVDPEAARIVLRSGVPIVLTPLNPTRKTAFTKDWFERVVAARTPLTELIRDRMGPLFEKQPDRRPAMFDQLAVASLIDPTLVQARDLFVDVDVNRGPNYGVSTGGERIWEGAEGAQKMTVQYDVDFARFIHMFVDRISRP